MTKAAAADSVHDRGFSCSQSVLTAFAPDLGLGERAALKVSDAFSGGMGGMGETCGAVTGAFMVIGLRYGRTRGDDAEAKARTETLVRRFVDRFEERHGSIVCRELLGYPVHSTEERIAAREKGLITVDCGEFIRDAAEIVEDLLAEPA